MNDTVISFVACTLGFDPLGLYTNAHTADEQGTPKRVALQSGIYLSIPGSLNSDINTTLSSDVDAPDSTVASALFRKRLQDAEHARQDRMRSMRVSTADNSASDSAAHEPVMPTLDHMQAAQAAAMRRLSAPRPPHPAPDPPAVVVPQQTAEEKASSLYSDAIRRRTQQLEATHMQHELAQAERDKPKITSHSLTLLRRRLAREMCVVVLSLVNAPPEHVQTTKPCRSAGSTLRQLQSDDSEFRQAMSHDEAGVQYVRWWQRSIHFAALVEILVRLSFLSVCIIHHIIILCN